MPGLQVVRTHDSKSGRGRQIYQFAGVEASTAYNISVLPTGIDDGPGAMGPTTPADLAGFNIDTTPDVPASTETTDLAASPLPKEAPPATIVEPTLPRSLVYRVTHAIRYLLRHPLSALTVTGLIFVAFALPLHLLERRVALAGITTFAPRSTS